MAIRIEGVIIGEYARTQRLGIDLQLNGGRLFLFAAKSQCLANLLRDVHLLPSVCSIYAEIDLEMKAKALGKCEVTEKTQQHKHWRDQPSLMEFLRTL